MAEARKLRLIEAARRDLVRTLQRSSRQFGAAAADRYAELIEQGLRDLRENPFRPGTRLRPETMGTNVYTYHLFFSRDRVRGERVQQPRHFLLYRVRPEGVVQIGRLLHDSRDLPRHVPLEFFAGLQGGEG